MSIPCSQATREQGEPLAGTAGVVAALVGISWPKALWDPDEAARSEGLPEEIWSLISDEKRSGRKIAVRLFQRAPRPPTDESQWLKSPSSFDERRRISRI